MSVDYAVFVGLDVGKGEHHACALDPRGKKLHDKPLPNDEQRLLRESDASVAEVAERVGYGSEFAFGNAFKREFGVAPGRYRRQVAVA